MKVTNKLCLPESLVRAVSYSDYNGGVCDYSVTGLLNPPRILALKAKYHDDIEEDASNLIFAAIGSAAHELFRRSSDGLNKIVEKRFFATVDGKILSGQVDLAAEGGMIEDFKISSIWAMTHDAKESWEQQLNIYRWLCKQNGIEIKALRIICVGRDWSKREASRDSNYPQAQVVVFNLNVWELAETERFIKERIALHEAAKVTLPECSPEDRWQKDDSFAVMKTGRKSAVKVHYKRELADQHLAIAGKGHYLQERKGTSIRCESYCSVASFCDWWKANKPKEDPATTISPEEAI